MSSSLVPSHVQVTVHKARDLNVKGKNGFSDVYFKLKVGKERQKVKTQNGGIDHDLCEWNHSTTLPLMCLDTALQITLYSKATFEDKFLGYISIPLSGFNLFGKPVTNWHSLTVKPNKPSNKVKVKGEIEVTVCFVSSPKEITTGLSRSKENLRKSNPTLLNHDSEGSRRDLRDRIRRSFRRKKTPDQHASLDLEALNISLKEDHKYMSRPVSLAMSNGAAQRMAQNLHRSSSEKEDNFKYFKEDALESEETQVRLQRRKFRRDSGSWGRKNSPRSCESLVQKNTSLGGDDVCVASNTSIRSCSSESTSAYFSGSNPKFDHQNSNMDRESNSTNSSLEDIKSDIKQAQCQVDLSSDVISLEPGQVHSTPKTSPVLRSRDSPSTVKRQESERQLGKKPSGVNASPSSSPTSLSKQNAHSSTPSLKHNTTGSEGYSPFNGKQPPPFIRAATHSTFSRKQQTTTRTSSSTPTATTPGTRPRSTASINRRTSLKELRKSPEASKDASKIFMLAKNAAAAAAATTASSSTGSSPVAKRKSSTEGDPLLEKIKPQTFVSSPSKKGHTVAYTKNSPMAHNDKFSVLPPSLQKQSSISGSVSLPTLSAFTQVESELDPRKPKTSLDVTDGKELATRSVLHLEGRRPSKQLEHLFHLGDQNEALLEEKRLEEEQKLKEYRAATKEDLIKELMRQREVLTQKDSELESVKTYLDNLLIRVMEVNPSLLDTVSQHKPKT